MVRFRGININAVSQIDAQRLPEYNTAQAFDALGAVAACYIPVYPGAQIWLGYSIDGPHPPKAAYFFKMLVDGQVVTSWDCTAKHEYCGKTVFFLQTVKMDRSGRRVVLQKSIAFANTTGSQSPNVKADCIEVRVHRIKHRRRLRDLPVDSSISTRLTGQGALRIVDNGPIELGRPARKYQYQLLDPQEEPYATFRFYCRTQEYFVRHQILNADQSSPMTSITTPTSNYFDTATSPDKEGRSESEQTSCSPSTPTKPVAHVHSNQDSTVTTKAITKSPTKVHSPRSETFSLIKDSIEDLPSTVPRSPQSSKPPLQLSQDATPSSPSPTRQSSPLLPEGLHILKIPKKRSPNIHIDPVKPPIHVSPILHLDCPPRLQPPPKFNLTPHAPPSPATDTYSPIRPHHERHKPSHLKITLDGSPSSFSQDTVPLLGPNLHRPFDAFPSNPALIPVPTSTAPSEHKIYRPLSPFTPSGFLRRLSFSHSLSSSTHAHTYTRAHAHAHPQRRPVTPVLHVPTVSEVDEVLARAVGEDARAKETARTDGMDRESEDTCTDSVTGSATKTVKQMCTRWVGGRPIRSWKRRQKVE